MTLNIETIKNELKSDPKILGWILAEENMHRRERYFLRDLSLPTTDQDREVHAQSFDVKLFVDNGKKDRQGEITKRLHNGAPLKEQIQSAILAAEQTDYQAWKLPTELPKNIPLVKSFDPEVVEDLDGVTQKISDEILKFTAKPSETRFDSAELFLSSHEKEVHLSNGLIHRSKKTKTYLEAAFSYAEGDRSDEYLHTEWSVSPTLLSVEEIFKKASDRARVSLKTEMPKTGLYWVMLDSDVLSAVFGQTFSQFTGDYEYLSLPHKKVGDSWIKDATGDLLSLTLDPTLDFGANTCAIGSDGLLQQPLEIVKNNQVVATSLDAKTAQYLSRKPTTSIGNIVLSPGSLEESKMTTAKEQVLEILQFSGLFVNPNSGTFSSEIRLAKLYDQKTGSYKMIKGGSLSGSINDNFKEAYFSKQRVMKMHDDFGGTSGYYGPKYALCSQVSIVGED